MSSGLELIISVIHLIYWFIVHLFKSDFKNHIKRNHAGEAIDIVVNGPSFSSQMDIVKNDGLDKCMVNFAANTPIFWELKPKFYCVSDPNFFRNASKNPDILLFIKNLKEINWEMDFFVTYHDYLCHIKNTDIDKLKYVKFIPFHSTPIPFSFKFRNLAFSLFKRGQAMPNPTSVAVPIIMNIINSGYSVINLYGYDQDWVHNVAVNDKNQVCLQETHFYNEKGVYRVWMKNEKEAFKMYEIMQSQTELFETYWFIREYTEYLGNVKILNRSSRSLIDAFDRK